MAERLSAATAARLAHVLDRGEVGARARRHRRSAGPAASASSRSTKAATTTRRCPRRWPTGWPSTVDLGALALAADVGDASTDAADVQAARAARWPQVTLAEPIAQALCATALRWASPRCAPACWRCAPRAPPPRCTGRDEVERRRCAPGRATGAGAARHRRAAAAPSRQPKRRRRRDRRRRRRRRPPEDGADDAPRQPTTRRRRWKTACSRPPRRRCRPACWRRCSAARRRAAPAGSAALSALAAQRPAGGRARRRAARRRAPEPDRDAARRRAVAAAACAPAAAAGPRSACRCARSDLRITRLQQRAATATLFVVDASGSSALHRLAEAKGAVELLLAECYVRRDQVGVIAFRGRGAEVLLPPTRSLVRAKRSLAALPGGGGTPLAAGLQAALGHGRAGAPRAAPCRSSCCSPTAAPTSRATARPGARARRGRCAADGARSCARRG